MPDKNCKTCHGLGGYPMCPECKNADDKGHCISLSGSVDITRRVFKRMLDRASDEPEQRRDFIYIWLEQAQRKLIKELQQNRENTTSE